jgi:hypothetical protein
MLHLAISCASYLLFFAAKALMPAQQANWRRAEQAARIRSRR